MLDLTRVYKVCSYVEREFTYRVRALWPRFSPAPCFAELRDDQGSVARIESLAGGPSREMIQLEASTTFNRRGEWFLFPKVLIPPAAAANAGNVHFSIEGPRFAPTFVSGFPSPCFEQQFPPETEQPPFPVPFLPFSINGHNLSSRAQAAFHARVINEIYFSSARGIALARDFAQEGTFIGGDCNPEPGTGVVILKHPKRVFLWMAGTTNANQLIEQFSHYIQRPVEYGTFGTNPYHYRGRAMALDLLARVGVTDEMPITLIGHSMGGAICWVLGVQMWQRRPARDIEVLTIGSPKIGDDRIFELAQRIKGISYANEEDAIPWQPVTAEDLGNQAYILFTREMIANVELWKRPPGLLCLAEDGSFAPGVGFEPQIAYLGDLVSALLASTPIPFLIHHLPLEYATRLIRKLP